MVHAALLLLMLEAVHTDLVFTISLKRSTQNLQLSTSSPADYPIFAQHRALGRKVSDEFVVPLCRGHHREVHRSGDEASWWSKAGIDPLEAARGFWTETHPLWSIAKASNPDQSTASRVATQRPFGSCPEGTQIR
jgi:hypothetical protein